MSLSRRPLNQHQIKFVVPHDLKNALQRLADERNITLSALLRLISSEYLRREERRS